MISFLLHLADNALVLGHRNSEWTGHGPVLEQDIALSNISLDLIGQARHLYQYAADLIGDNTTEDTLAYLRDSSEYKNCLLVEQSNGHWGKTVLRQFFFSAYQYPLYQQLLLRDDERLAGISGKSLKEVTYHLRWSSEWVIRLGQGTQESNSKMRDAIDSLWPYTQELYIAVEYDTVTDYDELKREWESRVHNVLSAADLSVPDGIKMITGGKNGLHTEELGRLLADMQYLQRTYPGVEW